MCTSASLPPAALPDSAPAPARPQEPGMPSPVLQVSGSPTPSSRSSSSDVVEVLPRPVRPIRSFTVRGVSALEGFWRLKLKRAKTIEQEMSERPAVREAFQTLFQICDLPAFGGQGLMNLLIGATHLSAGQRDQFWGALLRHIHLRCIQEFGVPESELGFSAFLGMFRRYNASCAKEVDVRFKDPLTVPAWEGHPASWIYIDSFDYQTEDREVQWELEGIPRPSEGLRLDVEAETQQSQSTAPPSLSSPGPLRVTGLRVGRPSQPPPADVVQQRLGHALASLPPDADAVAEFLRGMAVVLDQHFFPLLPRPSAISARLLAVDEFGNATPVRDGDTVDPTIFGATSLVVEPSASTSTSSEADDPTDGEMGNPLPCPLPDPPAGSSPHSNSTLPCRPRCDWCHPPAGMQREVPVPPPPGWYTIVDDAGNRWCRPTSLPQLQQMLQVVAPQCTALRYAHDQALSHLPSTAQASDLHFREMSFEDVLQGCAGNLPSSSAAPRTSRVCSGDGNQHIVVVAFPHLLEEDSIAEVFCWAHASLLPRGVLIVHEFDVQCREFHRLRPRWQAAWTAAAPAIFRSFDALAGLPETAFAGRGEAIAPRYRDAAEWRRLIEPFGFALCGLHYDKGDVLGTVHLVFAHVTRPPA
eukprot:GGOE01017928.1.p1 GENE.GGOE01017928.1~~GGOE01017928.1.p1  ORF type:complete len:660 (-),score=103.89 GGOE01017928.1:204-2126(-)